MRLEVSPRALRRSIVSIGLVTANVVWALPAAAQQTTPADNNDEIVVTGTRAGSSPLESAIPIESVSSRAISDTGNVDLRSSLSQIAPSISYQNFTAVGAAFKETITIHGLSANHVLVLVNGKRRHPSANITTLFGPQQVTNGTDLALIPVGSIDRIEILRDGDAANYGADALAGVVNIILKDGSSGGSLEGTLGQLYKGDGLSRKISANLGLPLVGGGYLNLSADYTGRNRTKRIYAIATPPSPIPNQPSSYTEAVSYNAALPVASNLELYSFGSFSHREGATYLSARPPASLPAIYPGGYVPIQHIKEDDFGATLGLRASDVLGWKVDISSTYGSDNADFSLTNTGNVGLYNTTGFTPTKFRIYSVRNTQWTNTADFSRPIDLHLYKPVTFSMGAEMRRELLIIGSGEPSSYALSGSQGNPGFSPNNAVRTSRTVYAGYVDIAANVTKNWQVGLAGRYENYSDTPDTLVGRFTTRYDFSDAVAIRGTVSTGFAAPTLAQQSFVNLIVSQAFVIGQLSPTSAAGRSIGAKSLTPEKSTSYSAGIVLRPAPGVSITVDGYQTSISKRIITGGTASGQTAVAALNLAGFQVPPTIPVAAVSASYLINGADTRTRGVDVTANYRMPLGSGSEIRWSLSGNVNETTLVDVATKADGSPALNKQQIAWLTTATPKYKVVAQAQLIAGQFSVTARENVFGPTTTQATYYSGPNAQSTTNFIYFKQPRAFTTDASIAFRPVQALELSVGANNIFNLYPNKLPPAGRLFGDPYDTYASQISIYGGYYYASVKVKF